MRDSIRRIVENLRYEPDTSVLVRVWIHNNAGVIWDKSIPAPAQIDMASKEVFVNPIMLGEMVEGVMAQKPKTLLASFVGSKGASKSLERILVEISSKYLILHEIGHDLYSPSVEMMTEEFNKSQLPQGLLFFCSNIVEDSFIQVEFQKAYPGADYRVAWRFGQFCYQGDLTGYEQSINNPQTLPDPVRTMLYYFILRAYNELEPKVIRLFDSPFLPWQPDTIELFDQAQHTVDTRARLQTTIKFAELVYRDLCQAQQQGKIPQDQGQGQGQGQGQPQGQGQSQGQGQPTTQTGNGQQGQGQPQNQGQSQSQTGASGNPSQQKGQSGNGQGGSESKDNKNQNTNSGKSLKQQIEEATQKLNKQLGDAQPHSTRTNQTQQDLRKRTQSRGAAMGAQAMGIRRTELSDDTLRLDEPAYKLYENCSTWFAKIFNESDYTIHGLDEGEVDPLLINEWFTEKNHRIFCQDVQVRQGRNIQVIFILDHSGSMGGTWGRFGSCARTLAAMVHAFDDAHIKSTVYDFANDVCLLKTADEEPELYGSVSNVLYALMHSRTGGGTDPSKAFEALCDDPAFMDDDEKIVFFLTDGEMGSSDIEKTVQNTIQTLTERGHWFFVSIGLDFSTSDVENLARFTKPGIVKAYQSNEISSKLGEDIFNLITEEFIKV